MMTVAKENLLVKFRSKDTQFGVTRGKVKALTKELDVNETILPAYEPDDAPLTAMQIKALRKDVKNSLPKGKTLSTEALFG